MMGACPLPSPIVTDQTSEVMRVLNRLIACDLTGLSEDELVAILKLTKDCRPLRAQAAALLHSRGWTRKQIGEAASVDPVTTWRWQHPTPLRPGERPGT
jgi:hypothetical protein